MKLKIGKETVQGFTRNITEASAADCYSYSASALLAIEFLRLNKAKETGLLMGFCILAFRQLCFAKIKRNPDTKDRLPLGTLLWKKFSTVPVSIPLNRSLKEAMGPLLNVIKLWSNNVIEK